MWHMDERARKWTGRGDSKSTERSDTEGEVCSRGQLLCRSQWPDSCLSASPRCLLLLLLKHVDFGLWMFRMLDLNPDFICFCIRNLMISTRETTISLFESFTGFRIRLSHIRAHLPEKICFLSKVCYLITIKHKWINKRDMIFINFTSLIFAYNRFRVLPYRNEGDYPELELSPFPHGWPPVLHSYCPGILDGCKMSSMSLPTTWHRLLYLLPVWSIVIEQLQLICWSKFICMNLLEKGT